MANSATVPPTAPPRRTATTRATTPTTRRVLSPEERAAAAAVRRAQRAQLDTLYVVLTLLFVLLMATDMGLTLWILSLRSGPLMARENNPIFAWWFGNGLTWLGILAKGAMTVAIARTLLWLSTWYPRQVAALFAFCDVLMTLVVAFNLHTLVVLLATQPR